LFITGRLKEMLIVGGENVFPREIEEVLNAHPSVKDSGVVGRSDPMRGEVPVAFIELKDDASHVREDSLSDESAHLKAPFDERALTKWCRERLAGYKVPDEIRVVESLPRNPTGKVMRRELKRLVQPSAALP
jgi:acyl-CoA synthetase (AMP-forming)/AMP-acid ligase II